MPSAAERARLMNARVEDDSAEVEVKSREKIKPEKNLGASLALVCVVMTLRDGTTTEIYFYTRDSSLYRLIGQSKRVSEMHWHSLP